MITSGIYAKYSARFKEKMEMKNIIKPIKVRYSVAGTISKLEKIEINNNKEIDVAGIFVSVGRVPENENFKQLINVNDKGYIISSENCHTNISGIFVAGDSRVKKLRQLVTATSDGAVAATEAIKYINKEEKNV